MYVFFFFKSQIQKAKKATVIITGLCNKHLCICFFQNKSTYDIDRCTNSNQTEIVLLVMGTRIFGKDEYFTEIIQEP